MAQERLAPDALLEQTNLSGTVADIDDDPDSPDAAWLTANSNNAASIARTSFPTPANPLTVGADLQEFRAQVRKFGGTGTPTARIELYDNGSLIRAGGENSVTGPLVIAFTWNANEVSSAANVECRVYGTQSGGGPAARASVEVGAVEWNAETSTVTNADAEISWTELEVPIPDGRADISWAELEVPTPDSRADVSWAEFETPVADRAAEVSWAELEVPALNADAEVSWTELEVPLPSAAGEVSWAELEVPTPNSDAEISWTEFEVPTPDSDAEVSWAEVEVPLGSSDAEVSFSELEVPTPSARAEVSWAEFQVWRPLTDVVDDLIATLDHQLITARGPHQTRNRLMRKLLTKDWANG